MTFLQTLEGIRSPILTALMTAISLIGTPFAILGIMEWFYLNVSKTTGYLMFTSYHLTCLLGQGIKVIVHEARPWIQYPTKLHPIDEAMFMATGYSFPSLHTANTCTYGVSRFMTSGRKATKAAMIAFMALVAFSRMYLGSHYPQDVLWGFLIAAGITIPVVLLGEKKAGSRNDGVMFFFLMAFGGLLLFLSIFLLASKDIDFPHSKDCFMTAGCVFGFALGAIGERSHLHFIAEDGSKGAKLLRFLIAVGGALACIALFHLVVRDAESALSMFFVMLEYALVVFWMTYIAPLLSMHMGLMHSGPSGHR